MSSNINGQLAAVLILAVLFACLGAWTLAWRYRAAMRRLMSAPSLARLATSSSSPRNEAPSTYTSPAPRSLAGNRRAAWALSGLLIAMSCLIAATSGSLWLALAFPGEPFAWKRAAVIALMHLWPVVPALALMWRWSLARVLLALAVWVVVCYGVMLWRSIEPQPVQALLALAVEIGPALVLVTLLCSSDATRAAAPWLLPPLVLLVWSSILGLDLLSALVAQRSAILLWLVGWLPATAALVLFALLPWLIAWWPLRWLGRALARAYARKWLSDLIVLFTAVWTMALLVEALSVASVAGGRAVAMLASLVWIPIVMTLNAALRGAAERRAPTLLVLRVFQRDAQVQQLFDHVVERWRVSGNIVLIAGIDLADRTLDADDIFTFIDGGLSGRFIAAPEAVAPRLAAFDMAADADGRFRVNECYCHDTTWQAALRALVQRSDVVLMDLRGFQAHNAGCRFELAALSDAPRLQRVVVLSDAQTDRAAADASIAPGAAGRFTWLDAAHIDRAKRHEVLAQLFGAVPAPSHS